LNPARNLLQSLADAVHSTGALDLVGALVLLLFLVLGFVRGFVGQAARLIAIVLGFLLARALAPRFAPVVVELAPGAGPGVATGVAYAGVFLLVLLATALVALLVKKAVQTLHLGFLDRLGGAAMGLLTGAVLHFALLVCVILFAREERLATLERDSRSLRAAVVLAQMVSPALPPEARRRIEAARLPEGEGPAPSGREGAAASAPAARGR
jgi:membrane protein required for colicin V production